MADFNNDGKPDIVLANEDPSTVSVYLGNGDGTFQSPITSNTTSPSTFVAVGDFNGDHKMDIVIVDHTYVSVLLGNGDGTFKPPIDNDSFPDTPVSLAVGDFNNDHLLDVAVVGSSGTSSEIGVLLGDGNGTLQPSINYSLTYTPDNVSVGDFDQNGQLDVAISSDLFKNLTVLLGNGSGGFGTASTYGTTQNSGSGPVIVSDFELNGKLDVALAAASGTLGGADVFWGNGDGTFQQAQFVETGQSGYPVLGDFNGDLMPDLVLADDLWLTTALNTGTAYFSPSAPLAFPVRLVDTTSPSQVVTLTNVGATALSISSFKVSGDFHANNGCGMSVAVGAKCEIEASFKPESVGALQGLITIIDSASSKPQVIELSGTGTEVKVSPNPMKFASQKVGTQSAPKKLAIENNNSTSITFSSIGAKTHDFAISGTGDFTSQPLAPGATCYVTVTFTPTKTGSRSAALYVTDSDAGSPQSAELLGTGT